MEFLGERMEALRRCAVASWAEVFLDRHLAGPTKLLWSVAIVRWARGQEYGLETLAIDKQVHSQLEHVIHRLEQESGRGETEVKANTNTRDPGVPRPCLLERERGRAPPCGSVSGQC